MKFIKILFILFLPTLLWSEVFTPLDVLNTQRILDIDTSVEGKIAYTLWVQRKPAEEAGSAYRELHLYDPASGSSRAFIKGQVSISSPAFSPDGRQIAFLSRRENQKKTQIWVIPVDGGEAVPVSDSPTSVSTFRWHPDGRSIYYLAETAPTEREEALKEKGYEFTYFEENLKHRNLYRLVLDIEPSKGEQVTSGITLWDFEFNKDGSMIAFSASPKNLIDHRYAFRKIYLLRQGEDQWIQLTDNPGKLGNYAFSPDNTRLAYTGALTQNDHAVSQAYVIRLDTQKELNLTPRDFRGHIEWVAWKDNDTVVYRAGEETVTTLSTVAADGGERDIWLSSLNTGFVFENLSQSNDWTHVAMVGESPTMISDVFYWQPGNDPQKVTDINPWLKDRKLGKQVVYSYKARDNEKVEGLLIYPVDYTENETVPLVVVVHGGPESHYSNGWVTRYSTPGQVLAGKGYAVFYPNYRSSTGYGVDFAMTGFNDAAGTEFDDIADGITALVKDKIADPERVGLGGGSYGGFASAWFASYYTEKVKAVCMFVGISNLISKRGTTDIPYEELYVHSGKKLEDMWEQSLKRSPIYYAHQSQTAVLILGGKADTRVHPSQSIEFYRRLVMNDHPAVRLVQYPGEGHGNARQPGRIDVLYRQLMWYDWYVKELNPLDGPMPPLDISDQYGLELP
jgi:dipeptidyl aminopeptidase/acylaminoacyl peptidase